VRWPATGLSSFSTSAVGNDLEDLSPSESRGCADQGFAVAPFPEQTAALRRGAHPLLVARPAQRTEVHYVAGIPDTGSFSF